jgi:hypothetical protein
MCECYDTAQAIGVVIMKSIWNDAARREIRERVRKLRADAPGRWGRMNAPQAVAHLADALRMAIGELPCTGKRLPLRWPIVKQLVIYWAPFPKGAPTAPELVGRVPATWSAEISELHLLIDRVAGVPASFAWPPHPAFGTLSRRAWGVLIYRHMDHHLTQFGA